MAGTDYELPNGDRVSAEDLRTFLTGVTGRIVTVAAGKIRRGARPIPDACGWVETAIDAAYTRGYLSAAHVPDWCATSKGQDIPDVVDQYPEATRKMDARLFEAETGFAYPKVLRESEQRSNDGVV